MRTPPAHGLPAAARAHPLGGARRGRGRLRRARLGAGGGLLLRRLRSRWKPKVRRAASPAIMLLAMQTRAHGTVYSSQPMPLEPQTHPRQQVGHTQHGQQLHWHPRVSLAPGTSSSEGQCLWFLLMCRVRLKPGPKRNSGSTVPAASEGGARGACTAASTPSARRTLCRAAPTLPLTPHPCPGAPTQRPARPARAGSSGRVVPTLKTNVKVPGGGHLHGG